MRVLFDNDVVLGYVLQRSPFNIEANELFMRLGRNEFAAYIAAITPINVFYVVRKEKNKTVAFQAVADSLSSFHICLANKKVLQNALLLNFSDYEDAVQHACAEAENLDAIVTRNLSDYKNATLPVYSPQDFLNLLKTR